MNAVVDTIDDDDDAAKENVCSNTNGSLAMAAETKKRRLNPMELRRQRRKSEKDGLRSIASSTGIVVPSSSRAPEIVHNVQRTKVYSQPLLSHKFLSTRSLSQTTGDTDLGNEDLSIPTDIVSDGSHSFITAKEVSQASSWMKSDLDISHRMDLLYSSVSHWSTDGLSNKYTEVVVPSKINTFSMLPFDRSLKTKLTVLTSFPSTWCGRRGNGEKESLHNFTRQTKSSDGSCNDVAIIEKSRLQWRFPCSRLPTSFLTKRIDSDRRFTGNAMTISLIPSKDNRNVSTFFSLRQRRWEEAFRSCYYMLRNGACDYFYVVGSSFVASFHNSNQKNLLSEVLQKQTLHRSSSALDLETKETELFAIVSKSNRTLRNNLRAAAIPFSTPCSENHSPDHVDNDVTPLAKDLNDSKCPIWSTSLQHGSVKQQAHAHATLLHGPDSLLFFDGHAGVHGLFDHLLNDKVPANQDVPLIISSTPFLNASIASLHISAFGQIHAEGQQELAEKKTKPNPFRFEVEGTILPENLRNLCTALEKEALDYQDDVGELLRQKLTAEVGRDVTLSFQVLIETDPKTVRFNTFPDRCEIETEKRMGREREPMDPRLDEKRVTNECKKRIISEVVWDVENGYSVSVS